MACKLCPFKRGDPLLKPGAGASATWEHSRVRRRVVFDSAFTKPMLDIWLRQTCCATRVHACTHTHTHIYTHTRAQLRCHLQFHGVCTNACICIHWCHELPHFNTIRVSAQSKLYTTCEPAPSPAQGQQEEPAWQARQWVQAWRQRQSWAWAQAQGQAARARALPHEGWGSGPRAHPLQQPAPARAGSFGGTAGVRPCGAGVSNAG